MHNSIFATRRVNDNENDTYEVLFSGKTFTGSNSFRITNLRTNQIIPLTTETAKKIKKHDKKFVFSSENPLTSSK